MKIAHTGFKADYPDTCTERWLNNKQEEKFNG